MLAVCFDECGDEVIVQVPFGVSREYVEDLYPEYRFRYFQSNRYTYTYQEAY